MLDNASSGDTVVLVSWAIKILQRTAPAGYIPPRTYLPGTFRG